MLLWGLCAGPCQSPCRGSLSFNLSVSRNVDRRSTGHEFVLKVWPFRLPFPCLESSVPRDHSGKPPTEQEQVYATAHKRCSERQLCSISVSSTEIIQYMYLLLYHGACCTGVLDMLAPPVLLLLRFPMMT